MYPVMRYQHLRALQQFQTSIDFIWAEAPGFTDVVQIAYSNAVDGG